MTEGKKDECCSTETSKKGCCCCGGAKKFIMVLLVAFLLFSMGFITGKALMCPPGICPLSGQPMNK